MILRCALAALVMATAPAPRVPEAPRDTVRAPSTIDASGATDVTGALNLFFASVPDGMVIQLRPGGSYRVDGTLQLADRHNIVLDGKGARIFASTEGARDRSHLWINKGSDIVIRNLVIKGAHPNGGLAPEAWRTDKAFQHGILVQGASNVELDRVHITDVFGDLVSIAWARDGTWCDGIWVHDSYLARNGRQGIAVTAGRDVLIEHNTITTTRRATIDLEPDLPKYGAENIHIVDNNIGPGLLRFVAAHGNGPINNVVIARNVLHFRDLAVDVEAPVGTRRSNFYVLDNTSDKQAGALRCDSPGSTVSSWSATTSRWSWRVPLSLLSTSAGSRSPATSFPLRHKSSARPAHRARSQPPLRCRRRLTSPRGSPRAGSDPRR